MRTSIDDIDSAWLTSSLAGAGALTSGEVAGFRTEEIGAGVGIMGLLYRLHLDYEPVGSGPATVVLKVPSRDPGARHVARTFRFYEKEVGFYNDFADQTPLPTPSAYAAEYDAEADEFSLLLADIGGATVHSQVEGCPPAVAATAARALARHHAAFADHPAFDDPAHAWLPFGVDPPTPQGVMQGVTDAWEPFKTKFPEHVSNELEDIVARYVGSVPSLLTVAADRPVTLLHGDYRLDNVFFGSDDVTVIDWQLCAKGFFAYDLAYFVTQSLTIEDRRAHEQRIIDAYFDELRLAGAEHDRDDFMADYRQTTMFCLCYPIQSGNVELVNDRARALVGDMFDRAMAAVRDHDATEFLTG